MRANDPGRNETLVISNDVTSKMIDGKFSIQESVQLTTSRPISLESGDNDEESMLVKFLT